MALCVLAQRAPFGKFGRSNKRAHPSMAKVELPGNPQNGSSLPIQFLDLLIEGKSKFS